MQDFFTNFAKVEYPVDGFSKLVVNLAIGEITIRHKVDEALVLWKKELLDEDTPVSISNDVYRSPEYYWTVLYINEIINPYTDWYVGQTELEAYTALKYESGKNGLHHFERRTPVMGKADRVRVLDDVDHAAALIIYGSNPLALPEHVFPVTNLQYERRLNDAKKTISVLNPRFVDEFSDNFHRIMRSKPTAPKSFEEFR